MITYKDIIAVGKIAKEVGIEDIGETLFCLTHTVCWSHKDCQDCEFDRLNICDGNCYRMARTIERMLNSDDTL